MQKSTEKFEQLITQDTRAFSALITAEDTIIDSGIRSIKFNGGSNRGDDFAIGSAVSQYIEISLADSNHQIESKELLVQIGMEVDSVKEYIPLGYFTAEHPETNEDGIKVVAYDRMLRFERPCFLDLSKNTNTIDVLNAISSLTKVPIVTSGLVSIPMDKPIGYTCREVLSYIAQLYGAFAICNRNGQIEIKSYSDANYTINTNRYWDNFSHSDFLYKLEKITCYTGKDKDGNSTSVSVGTGAREMSFSNPFMTKEILDKIWSTLNGYTYMPGSIRFLGDPRIDPWDIVTVVDKVGKSYKVPAMSLNLEFDGGLTTEIVAVGKSETEQSNGFDGPQTQAMDRYYAQLVMIDKALVNKLDVDTAKITYATITNLESTNANIENLKVNYGEFKNLAVEKLEAANAKINVLEADSANIKSLLSGNAGIGDLQNIHLTSANAVIDSALIRNAVMQTVTVGDLLAGKISTNKFVIESDDGGIKIHGATQQWKDKNGVIRMQAGKDAKGDFTFSLFDATGKGVLIDSTGIKPGAIANGLIVNDMVSDNANIAGSKLDITSVFESMNGSSSTLKSNRIWFDDKNQTLNQVYSQMSTDITNAGNVAQKALDAVNGIDTLDAISAVLTNDAHVVHTNADGSGGDYSDCTTTITVFSRDVDVSDKAVYVVEKSAGLTGTWDAKTRTYKVTGMTADNGWVDIDALYGTGAVYMTDRKGNKLKSSKGEYLTMRTGGAHIKKRFSISKAPDGRVGTSYKLKVDSLVLRKQQNGALIPGTIGFSAVYNDGQHLSSYAGRFKIEESVDGSTYVQKYFSMSDEIAKSYVPTSSNIKAIRCTLYASGGVGELDSQTVIVIVDAEGLPEEIGKVREGIQSVKTDVTNIQTGMEGIKANISSMETELHGVTDNTLLYNVQYADNGNNTVTLTAKVYKNGKDVTKTFPERWFAWHKKSESEDKYVGYGYGITVNKNDVGFGSTYIGRFVTYKSRYLTTRTGARLVTRKGNTLTTWIEE